MNYKEINIRKGIEAYFPYIISNPHNYSIEEIEKQDDEIFGIFDLCRENRFEIPVKNKLRLLFDLLEIQLSISLDEVAKIEWEEDPVIETVNHAADLLHWLNGAKIRTAVISNCDYSGNLLQEKLNIRLVPPLYPVPYCQPLKTGDLVFQRKENFQPPTLPLKI